jgi:hypothetical protein
MISLRYYAFVILAVFCFSQSAKAWMRVYRDDGQVVEEAEIIVMARLKPGSVRIIHHEKEHSWEHHLTLLVSEVLKGRSAEGELPIVVHYGLNVVTGRKMDDTRGFMAAQPGYPEEAVDLFDHGGMGGWLSEDIRRDHIWFLRMLQGRGREGQPPALGIEEPSDLQLPALRPYFQAMLSRDPEPSLLALAGKKDAAGSRSRQRLDSLSIKRIASLPDAGERARLLLPYYQKDGLEHIRAQQHAAQELLKCGNRAVDVLKALYEQETDVRKRRGYMRLLGKLGCKDPVLEVLRHLADLEKFWTDQNIPERKSWRESPDEQTSLLRQTRYEDLEWCLQYIGDHGTPADIPQLERTSRIWRSIEQRESGTSSPGVMMRRHTTAIQLIEIRHGLRQTFED